MKKLAVAVLMLPALAHAQAPFSIDPASAAACYRNLSATSARDELLAAIACLKGNAVAGESTVKDFEKSAQAILAKSDGEVKSALADLEAQKARHLYISYSSRWRDSTVFVVDKALLGSRGVPVADLSALNVKFTHTSSIFGKDQQVPLQEVKAFSYQQPVSGRTIGPLTTTLADGRQIVDKTFQGGFPIKVFDPTDEKKWSAIVAFTGTSYQGYPARKVENERVQLDQEGLAGVEINVLGEEEAKRRIAKVEQGLQLQQQAKAEADQAARAKSELIAQKKAQTLAEMAKVSRGAEDSCKRTDLGRYVVKYDPDAVEINCQFGGVVNLEDLKSAGWLVVNKTKDKDGVVTEYYIRKAR